MSLSSRYMLFAGWEVCVVKNNDRGLENAARGRRLSAPMSIPTFSYGGLPLPLPLPWRSLELLRRRSFSILTSQTGNFEAKLEFTDG